MPKTSRIEYSRTPLRRPIAFSVLILMAFMSMLALLTTGCRQDSQSLAMPEKTALALAGKACEDGLMALRAWECLSGGLRIQGDAREAGEAAGSLRP